MKLAMYEKCLSIRLKKLETTILMLLLRTMAWVMYTWSTQERGWQCTKVLSIKLKKLGDDHPHVANTYKHGYGIQEARQVR